MTDPRPTLLCLGHGYCAQRLVARHGEAFARRIGTSRDGAPRPGMEMLRFEGEPSAALVEAARAADVVVASAAPGEAGDPFLGPLGPALAGAGRRGPLVYLSTIGVYGDSGGAWIDEDAPLSEAAPRARRRIEAEAAWRRLGAAAGRPVALLRLGGIYGPGRNAIEDVAAGTARCIERAGQVFNRIHVDDIAGAIHAAGIKGFDGAVNVVDDEPSPSCAPVRFAAGLFGVDPPAAEPFEVAALSMSPMALSFWADNRRVRNEHLHALLGGGLLYPTYREGLAALLAGGAPNS
ncbi:NAD-dependent epimerase/dehydratase family protein [Ancylobacter sp. TS-1]|uniref:NAD-dependent epimerase/dehydratase family protein n=1 Tax=Ancylobacter sp. TS-1 TaxID=1850374 RepID=UPI001265D0BF|nr:NAD-dependent epimerase/dehydratase family protein [Ancylobacter sp. TS-1]QFR34128.1 NAD-dependent dehydratase [Ancylobacter sp. TS-1]